MSRGGLPHHQPMVPIAILLIPYGLFLLAFLFFSFAHIYHLIHFGRATGIVGFLATFIYIAVTVLLLYATYTATADIEWSRALDIFSSFTPPSFAPEIP